MKREDIPAFPLEMVYTQENEKFNGMTLRDYFAAKALLTVYPKHWEMFMDQTYDHPDEYAFGAAKEAYGLADAMMLERKA